MAFNPLGERDEAQELSEINIIPLVDVMLVLLILFIITAPLFTPHGFNINLPKADTTAVQETPDIIALAVKANGQIFWQDELLTTEQLLQRLTQSAQQPKQATIHLRADAETQYQHIAMVLEIVKQSGMEQLGFITQPEGVL